MIRHVISNFQKVRFLWPSNLNRRIHKSSMWMVGGCSRIQIGAEIQVWTMITAFPLPQHYRQGNMEDPFGATLCLTVSQNIELVRCTCSRCQLCSRSRARSTRTMRSRTRSWLESPGCWAEMMPDSFHAISLPFLGCNMRDCMHPVWSASLRSFTSHTTLLRASYSVLTRVTELACVKDVCS